MGSLYPQMQRVLMVSPEYFDVTYAINPHMKDSKGNLNQIDKALAKKQWENLRKTYETLGLKVAVLPGKPELPDMVFAANQSFCFWDRKAESAKVLLSEMRSPYRKPEVQHFKKWYQDNDYSVLTLESKGLCFEGNGDTLVHPNYGTVFGGYGPRTDKAIYEELSRRFQLEVVLLELVSEDFYHLDTCFSILNGTTVAIYPKAFSPESLEKIKGQFANVIEVEHEENLRYFACNCHCPNGKDVILQKGSKKFVAELKKRSFTVHEVDTSEFIKAGGSVFCMKMMLY